MAGNKPHDGRMEGGGNRPPPSIRTVAGGKIQSSSCRNCETSGNRRDRTRHRQCSSSRNEQEGDSSSGSNRRRKEWRPRPRHIWRECQMETRHESEGTVSPHPRQRDRRANGRDTTPTIRLDATETPEEVHSGNRSSSSSSESESSRSESKRDCRSRTSNSPGMGSAGNVSGSNPTNDNSGDTPT